MYVYVPYVHMYVYTCTIIHVSLYMGTVYMTKCTFDATHAWRRRKVGSKSRAIRPYVYMYISLHVYMSCARVGRDTTTYLFEYVSEYVYYHVCLGGSLIIFENFICNDVKI